MLLMCTEVSLGLDGAADLGLDPAGAPPHTLSYRSVPEPSRNSLPLDLQVSFSLECCEGTEGTTSLPGWYERTPELPSCQALYTLLSPLGPHSLSNHLLYSNHMTCGISIGREHRQSSDPIGGRYLLSPHHWLPSLLHKVTAVFHKVAGAVHHLPHVYWLIIQVLDIINKMNGTCYILCPSN